MIRATNAPARWLDRGQPKPIRTNRGPHKFTDTDYLAQRHATRTNTSEPLRSYFWRSRRSQLRTGTPTPAPMPVSAAAMRVGTTREDEAGANGVILDVWLAGRDRDGDIAATYHARTAPVTPGTSTSTRPATSSQSQPAVTSSPTTKPKNDPVRNGTPTAASERSPSFGVCPERPRHHRHDPADSPQRDHTLAAVKPASSRIPGTTPSAAVEPPLTVWVTGTHCARPTTTVHQRSAGQAQNHTTMMPARSVWSANRHPVAKHRQTPDGPRRRCTRSTSITDGVNQLPRSPHRPGLGRPLSPHSNHDQRSTSATPLTRSTALSATPATVVIRCPQRISGSYR